jgi:hypothetical protein
LQLSKPLPCINFQEEYLSGSIPVLAFSSHVARLQAILGACFCCVGLTACKTSVCIRMQAIKQGNIADLNSCLQENQWRFIQAGVYLLLEKLKQSVFRRLLKRVALIHREEDPAKAFHIPLGDFLPGELLTHCILRMPWTQLSSQFHAWCALFLLQHSEIQSASPAWSSTCWGMTDFCMKSCIFSASS